ncbi:MAG: hypothetical protein ACRBB0_21215 [Pelagimonas sp.]|uniref:hypothetical protein n=1 Tax=Pelagimonas sp. TaxID=2073170 RepID=UPI003D6A8778
MPDFASFRSAVAQLKTLPIKERRKQAKALGYAAMELEKAGALQNAKEMTVAIEALAAGAMAHYASQRLHMSRARLMRRRREALGDPEPKILLEKARTLDVEAGGLWIQDASKDVEYSDKEPLHSHMNRLGYLFLNLGGDGAVKVRLRIHESGACEPQSLEFRRLREATQDARLSCPTGKLRISGGGAKKLEVLIPAGNHRVAAYGLGIGRVPECLILVSPQGDRAPDPLTDTPELQL